MWIARKCGGIVLERRGGNKADKEMGEMELVREMRK